MEQEDRDNLLKFIAENYKEPLHLVVRSESVEKHACRDGDFNGKIELIGTTAEFKPFRFEYFPVASHTSESLDDVLNLMFKHLFPETKEDYSCLKLYQDLKSLYGQVYESFADLKKALSEIDCKNFANKIEMVHPRKFQLSENNKVYHGDFLTKYKFNGDTSRLNYTFAHYVLID